MSTREQIEADYLLAHRLQQEEIEGFNIPPPLSPQTPPDAVPPPRMIPEVPRPPFASLQDPNRSHGSESGADRDRALPYVQRRDYTATGDVLSEVFRQLEEGTGGRSSEPPMENLREFGGEGRGRRWESELRTRRRNTVGDVIMEGVVGMRIAEGPFNRRGRYEAGGMEMRDGERRWMDIPARESRHERGNIGEMERMWDRQGRVYGSGAGRGTPHEIHQHHIFERRNGQYETTIDFGAMVNEVFTDFFTRDGGRTRIVGGRAGGMPGIGDFLRSMLASANESGQYEDWLEVIERMGGNVNRGATDAEIGNLPSEKYHKGQLERDRMQGQTKGDGRVESKGAGSSGGGSGNVEEEDKCAICLGDYEEGEEVKTLPCFHMFHTECVDRWLKVNKTCPFCKRSIRPENGGGDRV